MSVLDLHNRSLSVVEANRMAMEESEGRLSIVEHGADVFAVYRGVERFNDADMAQHGGDFADRPANGAALRQIPMTRLALTAWTVFEMARAAGPRPQRMVHGRASRSLAPEPV